MSYHKYAKLEWATRQELGSLWLIRFFVRLALWCGRDLSRLFLYPITLYFYLSASAARQASKQFLQMVQKKPVSIFDCFRHFLHFSQTLLDRVYLLHSQGQKFVINLNGEKEVNAAIEKHKGLFLFGAHMGSFEVMRCAGHNSISNPIALLMFPNNAQKINAVLQSINPKIVQEIIPLGESESMLRVAEVLENEGIIGILADRYLDSPKASQTLTHYFLGKKAVFSKAPFVLAYVLKKPVFLMLGIYINKNHYEVILEEIADFSNSKVPRRQAIDLALIKYIEMLEFYCRKYPNNWFNFFDFWKAA